MARNKAVSAPQAPVVAEPVKAPMSRDNKVLILIAAALAVVTIGLYWPVHTFGFMPSDDELNIQTNPYFHPLTWSNVAYFWNHPFGALYIPVSYTVYAFVCLFAHGPHDYLPGPFHVANLVIHVMNTLLVYAILLRLVPKAWAAGLGAALFAVHPVQVGSVAWITETRGLVSALFSLLAILGYVYYAQSAQKAASRPAAKYASRAAQRLRSRTEPKSLNLDLVWLVGSTACFILALLSKPSAVSVPIMAAAIDLWLVRRQPMDVAKLAGPWAILALVIIGVTGSAQPVETFLQLPLWQRPVVMCFTLAFYTAKVLVPSNLAFDYADSSPYVVTHPWCYWAALAGVVLIALLAWLGRRWPWVWACAAIFAAVILPVSGLAPFMYQAISTVADRYIYLAMLAPALALAIVLAQWPRVPAIATAGCVVVVYGIVAAVDLPYWHDEVRLLTRTTQVTPRSWFAWADLGTYYMRTRNIDAAMKDTKKCLAIYPHFKIALSNLSALLLEQGDINGALQTAQDDLTSCPGCCSGAVPAGSTTPVTSSPSRETANGCRSGRGPSTS
ncbi:MAG: tetratricopeptide repeat protein [Capsulimonadaceae bacterium]